MAARDKHADDVTNHDSPNGIEGATYPNPEPEDVSRAARATGPCAFCGAVFSGPDAADLFETHLASFHPAKG